MYLPSEISEFKPWVALLMQRLVTILATSGVKPRLLNNAAATIGRLGLMHPELIGPSLAEFMQIWCQVICKMSDGEDKNFAFRGLCALAQANPVSVSKV
jgi:transportin-1